VAHCLQVVLTFKRSNSQYDHKNTKLAHDLRWRCPIIVWMGVY